ncbi:nitroreductase [Saccharomonospora sp. CUA-673]|uniref:nitroreductase family protein n=1 Tax=Saccharomonospora sp. CUA-673 TaxID=1904969 RepID=UPI00095F1C8B|nr:nitroreductase family protein [Saccharomonospora sp. CUA-673]OLT41217.1 nitroreductase [Saccharomonospora sp. CUA-673]
MVDEHAARGAGLHELIAGRWSPRLFDPAHEVTDEQLRRLLEAARWAPSFGNTQPARFVAGLRGDDTYERALAAVSERNQAWAHRAGALVVTLAVRRNEKGDVPYAEYGAGLAAENLVLQAVAEGLAAHQMAGFDAEQVRSAFAVPDDVTPMVVVAVGKQADPESLSGISERDADRERAPSTRLPLSDIAFTGTWGRGL